MKEKYLLLPFPDCHIEVLDSCPVPGKFSQLVIVSGKKGLHSLAPQVMQEFGNRPGDAHTVESAGPPSDFIQYDKTLRCRLVQNVCGLLHFDHESGAAARKIVGRPDPSENAVYDADARFESRDEGADLGQEHDQGGLPENGGFSSHVWAGYDEHLLAFLVEFQIVWDKTALGQKPLYNGMSSIPDMDGISRIDHGFTVIEFSGNFRKRADAVEERDYFRHLLYSTALA